MRKTLSIILAVFAAISGFLIMLPRLHQRTWITQIALTELPYQTAFAGLIAAVLGKHKAPLAYAFGLLGGTLSLLPVAMWWSAHRNMNAMMIDAFGTDYEQQARKNAPIAPSPMWNPKLFNSAAHSVYDVPFVDTPQRTLKLDVYQPVDGSDSLHPGIVMIHGGGWCNGNKGQYFARHHRYLASLGYVVFDIQYRLTEPDQSFWPAQLEDIRAAIRFVRSNAADYTVDPERLALYGRSAGGHLALSAAYRACNDHADTTVKAVVSVYGPANMLLTGPTHDPRVITLLGGTSYEQPENYHDASPLEFAHAGAPPTLLIHGYKDGLVTPIHSEMLSNRLKLLGVPCAILRVPWGRHGFDAIPFGLGSNLTQYYVDRFLALTLRD